MTMTAERYMTPMQAARLLGLSNQTVHDLFDRGRLAGIRTPLGRLIEREAVEAEAERRAGRVA